MRIRSAPYLVLSVLSLYFIPLSASAMEEKKDGAAQCDEQILVIDDSDSEEDMEAARKAGGHTCRPGVVPWPKFSTAAPTVSAANCSRETAVNEVLASAAAANCTGDKEPQCDGGCGEKKCKPFTRRKDDSPIVTCTSKFDPQCNGKPLYTCTLPVGEYKCGCKCQ